MPDTFCISLMFIGLYCGYKYLDKAHPLYLILYIVLSSLAMLTKIPAGIYLVIILMMTFNSKTELKHKIIIGLSSTIPLLLAYLWHFVWNPHLAQQYENWYNSGKTLSVSFNEIKFNLDKTFANFYFSSFYSYILFSLFIFGLFLLFYKKNLNLIFAYSGVFILFVLYIFKSGFYFYLHNYYIIPFVPVMALVAGYAVSFIHKKWLFSLIIFICIGESIANQQHDFFIKKSELYKMNLETITDSISIKTDLIAINGEGNPQQIYLTHRKGWSCNNDQILDSVFVNKITRKGCKYLIINQHAFSEEINREIVFENSDFKIFRLSVFCAIGPS